MDPFGGWWRGGCFRCGLLYPHLFHALADASRALKHFFLRLLKLVLPAGFLHVCHILHKDTLNLQGLLTCCQPTALDLLHQSDQLFTRSSKFLAEDLLGHFDAGVRNCIYFVFDKN